MFVRMLPLALVALLPAACVELNPEWAGPPASTTTGVSSDSASTSSSSSTSTTTSASTSSTTSSPDVGGPMEICDGVDNDGDGLVDEHSPSNDVCGSCILFQRDGRAYFSCDEDLAWEDARAACQGRGADLVSIPDLEHNDYVEAIAADAAWIGLNDRDMEGVFVWADGDPSTFTNWNTGEPNDQGKAEDCAQILVSGLWNDEDCATVLPAFVCWAPHTP